MNQPILFLDIKGLLNHNKNKNARIPKTFFSIYKITKWKKVTFLSSTFSFFLKSYG